VVAQPAAVVQSVAIRCCASASGIDPAQTRRCSSFSTLSFGFGDVPGSGQRFRWSLEAPPSSSEIRWSSS
jgi:hypothetical protein